MSDEGEKTCPLCAEEMDLTDQQLKPCRCGYEICVWCWHHIMDMAEKDDIEGRCPACRAPYDKEKIVGMAASCERLVSEISTGKKMKSQKSKTKPSEGRKQLSSVRVIQRNLVYIVGLPLDLADEDLLQHREYFAQYGKVLKVSMSRTASGVIQQFPNNTCSVYITYSKEEEAVRCIQSVHGFILDGRSLRACFGTTKYCHAWLRNMPCSNPDCMYLHEIGSHEDSFTKDEIISAYTRSRVQQIMGPTNNLQRRSGNLLPPPADDFCINSIAPAGKPIVKIPSNNTPSTVRDSPPNGSTCKSLALPAAASWGTRSFNCQSPASSLASLNGPSKNKSDTVNGTLAISSAVENTTQASPLPNVGKKSAVNEESHALYTKFKSDSVKPLKTHIGFDSQNFESEKHAASNTTPGLKSFSSQLSSAPALNDNDGGISMPQSMTFSLNNGGQPCASAQENEAKVISDGKIQNLCSDVSSMSIDGNVSNGHSVGVQPNNSDPDNDVLKNPGKQGLQKFNPEQFRESLNAPSSLQTASLVNGISDWRADSKTIMPGTFSEVEDDILSFDNQRLKDPEVVSHLVYMPNSANSIHVSNHSRSHSLQHNEGFAAVNLNADRLFVDNKVSDDSVLHQPGVSILPNGYPENLVTRSTGSDRAVEGSFLVPNQGKGKHMERSHSNAAIDAGESSIISDILSMDFNAWDDPLTSPQNLAKLWGETDKQPGSVRTSSRKIQTSNQSRFSFARQEDSRNKGFDVEVPLSVTGLLPKNRSFDHGFSDNRDSYFDKFGSGNGFSANNLEELDSFATSHSSFSSNRHSVSRAQISTPPGFSIPSRAPPPGFSSHERMDPVFDTVSGNHLLDTSSLLRNTLQSPPTGNIGNSNDIEFMDPAILAVGKGRFQGVFSSPGLDMRQNFPQLNTFENDARLQLLMQRSLSSHQNVRFPDVGDRYSSRGDSYGTPPRIMDQSQVNGLPPFGQLSIQQSRNGLMSNGHWDGWNEVHSGNNLSIAELLRNERLGLNKYYNGYEDSKFRMTSSGDLYNRTFGM